MLRPNVLFSNIQQHNTQVNKTFSLCSILWRSTKRLPFFCFIQNYYVTEVYTYLFMCFQWRGMTRVKTHLPAWSWWFGRSRRMQKSKDDLCSHYSTFLRLESRMNISAHWEVLNKKKKKPEESSLLLPTYCQPLQSNMSPDEQCFHLLIVILVLMLV